MNLKNSYEQYLRKKYDIPDECDIITKRGFVMSKSEKLAENENAENDPFKIRSLVYKDIKNDIEKIHDLIEKANEEIDDLLRLKESAEDTNEQIYDLQIELIVDDLFSDLSSSIKALTNQAYKSFLLRLNENSNNEIEYLYDYALLDKEIYSKINLWIENLKNWFVDKIDHSDIGLNFQTKSCFKAQTYTSSYDFLDDIFETTTKGFFDDILGSVEDFFSSLKNRIDRLIFNVILLIQTEVKKIYYHYVKGVDCYKVVLSDNINACEKCKEMDGKAFYISELQVGKTAPPFHPNCGCTIIKTRTTSTIDEPLTLADPLSEYNREDAIRYAMQWFDGQNPEYPSFGDIGDCANFVSQCLIAGGFKMNEYWHCYYRNEIYPVALFKPYFKWIYTEAWAAAKDQYEYLKNSDMVKEEIILTSSDQIANAVNDSKNPVKIGDIMYLQFDKDYPHHATIISKVEGGMIYYAAHTISRNDQPLSDFFRENPNGQAYILRIK